jgi:hypothetical protein
MSAIEKIKKEEKEKKERTLSEEFFSRSPFTQSYIKSLVMTIPTSKYKHVPDNVDKYNESSPATQQNMVVYGLVPPTMLRK